MVMGSIVILFMPFVLVLFNVKHTAQEYSSTTPFFGLSTLSIIFSSIFLSAAKRAKDKDSYKGMRRCLFFSVCLGLLFLTLQYNAWMQLFNFLNEEFSNIVMVIVATHALHFLIALLLLVKQLFHILRVKTSADLYIYFLAPKNKYFFQNCRLYWDFLGALWALLYILFLLKSL